MCRTLWYEGLLNDHTRKLPGDEGLPSRRPAWTALDSAYGARFPHITHACVTFNPVTGGGYYSGGRQQVLVLGFGRAESSPDRKQVKLNVNGQLLVVGEPSVRF